MLHENQSYAPEVTSARHQVVLHSTPSPCGIKENEVVDRAGPEFVKNVPHSPSRRDTARVVLVNYHCKPLYNIGPDLIL